MLVLSRKLNEEIIINGGQIRIIIAKVNKDQVRIGIEAPKNITIDRGEIHKIKQTFTTSDTSCNLLPQKTKEEEDKVQL